MTLLARIFGKQDNKSNSARLVAKDRLKLVLLHDRADIPAPMLEQMRQEIIAVIAKYVEINEAELKVDLERVDTEVALVANILIRRVRA